VDNNHTVKQIGDRYRVFINLGNGMRFLLHGSYDTEADAEAAYARWKSADEKWRNWNEFPNNEGTWG